MLSRLRPRLSYANVVSTLCLFIVLGGSAYAVATIGSNDIKNGAVLSRHIQDRGVANVDLGPNSVGSGKVIDDSLTDKDVKESTLNVSGPTHEVGAGGEPGFLESNACDPGFCAWGNYGSGEWQSVGFVRDRAGVVHLKGIACIKAIAIDACGPNYAFNCLGQPSTQACPEAIFVLPEGFRPPRRALFSTLIGIAGNKLGRVDAFGGGEVQLSDAPFSTVNGNTKVDWVSLDGISFRCGPSGQHGCP